MTLDKRILYGGDLLTSETTDKYSSLGDYCLTKLRENGDIISFV